MQPLKLGGVKSTGEVRVGREGDRECAGMSFASQAYYGLRIRTTTAGRPALHGSEPGQVRKEAATAIFCKCRGTGSPPILFEKMVGVQ